MKYQFLPVFPPATEAPRIIKMIDDDGKESFIPMDDGNADYQEYLRFLDAGGITDAAS